jgi:hypothetical protein
MRLLRHPEHGDCWIGDHQDPTDRLESGWRWVEDDLPGNDADKLPADDNGDDDKPGVPLTACQDLEGWADAYAVAGVHTLEQLADMEAEAVNALPIKGIGAKRAAEHVEIARNHLSDGA